MTLLPAPHRKIVEFPMPFRLWLAALQVNKTGASSRKKPDRQRLPLHNRRLVNRVPVERPGFRGPVNPSRSLNDGSVLPLQLIKTRFVCQRISPKLLYKGVIERDQEVRRCRKIVANGCGMDPVLVVGRVGIEPTTNGLKVRCSTN